VAAEVPRADLAAGELRLFVALQVPAHVRERLATVQKDLAAQGISFRWMRAEAMHLTLVFLGATPASVVEPLGTELGRAAEQTPPFELTAAGLGWFPNVRRPRVLWAGLIGDLAPLHQLHRRVMAGVRRLGISVEERAFHPHLTLGRAAGQVQAPLEEIMEHRTGSFGTWRCDSVALIRSDLGPAGSQYHDLIVAPLGHGQTA
jgi:2'-5' RNA ligase